MTWQAVLVASLALNVASGAVMVLQRVRNHRLASLSCPTCPFVTGVAKMPASPPGRRTTVPLLEVIEPRG